MLDLAEDTLAGTCAADVRLVTFVVTPPSENLRPPFVVDFGDTSVRVDEADTVAAANRGEGGDWTLLLPSVQRSSSSALLQSSHDE